MESPNPSAEVPLYERIYAIARQIPRGQVVTYGQIAQMTGGNRDRLLRAIKLGVPIAFGSDEYYDVPGLTRGQASLLPLHAYLEDGLTPLQVLQAATVNAAELLGWSDRIGTLEPGKLADIIAVPGDALADPRSIERVSFVMKGGTIVKRP